MGRLVDASKRLTEIEHAAHCLRVRYVSSNFRHGEGGLLTFFCEHFAICTLPNLTSCTASKHNASSLFSIQALQFQRNASTKTRVNIRMYSQCLGGCTSTRKTTGASIFPPTLTGFRFTGGFGFVVLGVLVELASLSLEELSVEDSELVLSTLDEFVPSLIGFYSSG